MSETLSGAQILCRTLVEEGVRYLFGYPGGATNHVTGLATAHMDSSPVLAITGQVSRPMIGRDAFQETDVIGITLPITKANWRVQDASELADTVREAVAVALDGRPGPVLVDVPKDVQNQKAEYRAPQDPRAPHACARGQSLAPGSGLRFDDRVTGNTAAFAPRARIVHVDRDPAEIGKNVKVTVGIVGDAREVTRRLIEAVAPRRCDAWWEEIRGYMRVRDESWRDGLSPEAICRALFAVTGEHCSVVTDVGQHQMWVAKLFPYRRPNGHVTSGGLGAMGFAVPAAMGVHLARPDEPVWAISGDGGFQMNMAEIATMVQEGLAVKMAVFNNGYLGMVRQWQQFFHGKRYSCTPIWSPDYVKLAAAYGIPGWRVERARELEEVFTEANAVRGPALVELVIEQEANVFPMIPPGGSLSEPIETAPAAAAT